jgi:tetratricopeptide (TPR) repeat protein/DNA-binding XRE family transcriptional regulator
MTTAVGCPGFETIARTGVTAVKRWSGREARLLRQALRLTVREFAEDVGVDPRTISKWESGGSAHTPRPELQRALDTMLRQASEEDRERFHVTAWAAPDETSTHADAPPATMEAFEPAPPTPLLHFPECVMLPVVVSGRPVFVPLDAEAVAASGLAALLGALGVTDDSKNIAITNAQWDVMSPLDRRSLLKQGLAAVALPALGLPDAEHVAAALDDARHYLDGSVVDYFRGQLAFLKADDGQLGTRATLPLLLGMLGAIQQHAGDVKPTVRRDLLSVGADCAEFAGWLYRDARDTARATYCHDRAVEWAQEAGDDAMQAYVLLKKAQLAYDEREPVRMLTLTQAVEGGTWSLPLRVQAEAVQQVARAEAMLGASVSTIENQLGRARDLLHEDEEHPYVGHVAAHYDHPLLAMQTAVCYVEAGQPRRAVDLYEEALTEEAFSPRDYGFFLSWKAAAQALAGQPDEAARTGLASAARATEANSHRTKRELIRVLDTLQPWHYRPAVRELAATVSS